MRVTAPSPTAPNSRLRPPITKHHSLLAGIYVYRAGAFVWGKLVFPVRFHFSPTGWTIIKTFHKGCTVRARKRELNSEVTFWFNRT